ncbi:MAG: hypothetical protein HQK88_09975 [Nitrospirae bacterium]|nr:hypothetical protein [Nitrospirota bacterium]MBF0534498.1 hypothetical protein [Nitrospirota bacterium]MBF0617124.1 hypothetical protein [Nitrospirota bacterium]
MDDKKKKEDQQMIRREALKRIALGVLGASSVLCLPKLAKGSVADRNGEAHQFEDSNLTAYNSAYSSSHYSSSRYSSSGSYNSGSYNSGSGYSSSGSYNSSSCYSSSGRYFLYRSCS